MDADQAVGDAEVRRTRPLRRVAALLIVGALVLAGVGALVTWRVAIPTFVSYWIVDSQTLGVQTVCGPPPEDSSAVTGVVETATTVRVFAECRRPGLLIGGETAVGYLYDFTVRLAAPLASRTVLDGNGLPATHCPEVRCGAPSADGREQVWARRLAAG